MKVRIQAALIKVLRTLKSVLKVSSIRSVITLSFTAVTVLSVIFVSFALYQMFSQNAEKNAASSTQQIMDQVNLNLEYYLKEMMEISDLIRGNFGSGEESKMGALRNLLDTTSKIRKDIVTMAIYTDKGDIVMSNPSGSYDENFTVTEQAWFKTSLNNTADYLFQPPHVQRIFDGKRPWVVSLCRGFTFYEGDRKVTRVIMVDMNFSIIEQLCKRVSLGKRGYIYVIDRNGDIIYHPQQQLIYTGLKDENIHEAVSKQPGSYIDEFSGERRIMTVQDMSYTGWKMVGISYADELTANKKSITYFILYISIFGIVFEILASIFISAKISQPIKRLEGLMKKVENGEFDINLEVKGEDEVKRLSKSFSMMVSRIKQLMDQSIREQKAMRRSEFKALQAQINPHFLYNTLDSIIWMNENQNHEGVSAMVAALAKFFRISISKGSEMISIRDEIEHARSYLTIQQTRYKDKFDFTIEAESEVLEHKTIKLILQPIIENSIYHGISQLQEKGIIKITVLIENNTIVFSVMDNGNGIKPAFLKEILRHESKNEQSYGVGLKNVDERIKLSYGNEYGIEIESELDVGTEVSLRIPLTGGNDGGKDESNS